MPGSIQILTLKIETKENYFELLTVLSEFLPPNLNLRTDSLLSNLEVFEFSMLFLHQRYLAAVLGLYE